MKGHMKDGEFHPHTEPKGISRKKRLDYNDPDLVKNSGVKLEHYLMENGHKYRLKKGSTTSQLEKKWFELTDVERIKLHILSGTEPRNRPDIEFGINVINQGARREIFKLMRKEAWKKPLNIIPPDQIMGIQALNNGEFNLNIIQDGEVKQRHFKTLGEAKLAKNRLKAKGFLNHQPDNDDELIELTPEIANDINKVTNFSHVRKLPTGVK